MNLVDLPNLGASAFEQKTIENLISACANSMGERNLKTPSHLSLRNLASEVMVKHTTFSLFAIKKLQGSFISLFFNNQSRKQLLVH